MLCQADGTQHDGMSIYIDIDINMNMSMNICVCIYRQASTQPWQDGCSTLMHSSDTATIMTQPQ